MKKLLGCTFLLASLLVFLTILTAIASRFGPTPSSKSKTPKPVYQGFRAQEPQREDAVHQISSGDTVTATVPGDTGQLIALAIDEPAFTELNTAMYAKDVRGMFDLTLSARVFSIPNFTRVKVIENGLLKCRVRIVSGQMAGRSGWINRDFLK